LTLLGVPSGLAVMVVSSKAEVHPLGWTKGVVRPVAITVVAIDAITESRDVRVIFTASSFCRASQVSPSAHTWRRGGFLRGFLVVVVVVLVNIIIIIID
jgi:hypothetical protein